MSRSVMRRDGYVTAVRYTSCASTGSTEVAQPLDRSQPRPRSNLLLWPTAPSKPTAPQRPFAPSCEHMLICNSPTYTRCSVSRSWRGAATLPASQFSAPCWLAHPRSSFDRAEALVSGFATYEVLSVGGPTEGRRRTSGELERDLRRVQKSPDARPGRSRTGSARTANTISG
jgi:hypothetical protein